MRATTTVSDAGIFDTDTFGAAIKNQLENIGLVPDDSDRTLDVGSSLSGLVSGGFDKLGYIPLATAVGQCEGQARARWVQTDILVEIISDNKMTRLLLWMLVLSTLK